MPIKPQRAPEFQGTPSLLSASSVAKAISGIPGAMHGGETNHD